MNVLSFISALAGSVLGFWFIPSKNGYWVSGSSAWVLVMLIGIYSLLMMWLCGKVVEAFGRKSYVPWLATCCLFPVLAFIVYKGAE